MILNNLGIIYMETGNYVMAREALERALAIRRSKLREGHPWIAHTLSNLGFVLLEQRDLSGARRALEESLAICEKQNEKREIAQALSNLAEVLIALGDYASARKHLERALELQTSVWGPEHRDVGLTLLDLGWLFLEAGEYEKAVESLSRAVLMLKKTVGPSAPQLAQALSRLALAYQAMKHDRSALESAIEAETVARHQFRDTTQTFSEKEALQYASVRVSGMDVALSLLEEAPGRLPPDAADRVFDQLVRSRALVLDEMATRRPSYLREGPPDLENLAQEMQKARKRLAKLALVDAKDTAKRFVERGKPRNWPSASSRSGARSSVRGCRAFRWDRGRCSRRCRETPHSWRTPGTSAGARPPRAGPPARGDHGRSLRLRTRTSPSFSAEGRAGLSWSPWGTRTASRNWLDDGTGGSPRRRPRCRRRPERRKGGTARRVRTSVAWSGILSWLCSEDRRCSS